MLRQGGVRGATPLQKAFADEAIALPQKEKGEVILICRHGKPVAERRAATGRLTAPNPSDFHPELAAKILYGPTEPATADE